MNKKMIEKKVNTYYRVKWILVIGMFISLILMFVTLGLNLWCPQYVSKSVPIIMYVVMLIFVFVSTQFPVGIYNLKDSLDKNDIGVLLDYISEFKGNKDKFYDMLFIISRTTRSMSNDYSIMNRVNADKENGSEKKVNETWDRMSAYFCERDVLGIKRDDVLEYVEELKKTLSDNEIEYDEKKLRSIELKKKDLKTRLHIRWNVFFIYLLFAILLLIVLFKIYVLLDQKLMSELIGTPFEFIYQTGTDIMALAFGLFSVKAEK